MNKLYFTPGPSQLYFTVEEHLKIALRTGVGAISHRSKDFQGIYQHAETQLRELLQLPDNYQTLFVSSATEVWERMIQNLVSEKTLHYINGAFSNRFYKTSTELGKEAIGLTGAENEAVQVTEEYHEGVELIGMVQNETSTGISQPLEDIVKVRKLYPESLLSLDVVSSSPFVQLDFTQIDMAYFSVQKCFGLPAGLGVWLVNDRTIEKSKQIQSVSKLKVPTYRQLPEMIKHAQKYQTASTPNVLDIYLLGKVAEDMNIKGLEMIRRETKYKAAVLYHCISEHGGLSPFVEDARYQSQTTVIAKANDPKHIIEQLLKKGLVIGSGYGKYKEEHIRIANFPTHSKEQIELLVDQINKL